jgi:hypothetical protein
MRAKSPAAYDHMSQHAGVAFVPAEKLAIRRNHIDLQDLVFQACDGGAVVPPQSQPWEYGRDAE